MNDDEAMFVEHQCAKLIYRYFEAINPLEIDSLLALFSETAVVVRTGARAMRLEGKEAIGDYLAMPQAQPKTYLAQNITINVLDESSAEGRCLAVVMAAQTREDRDIPSAKLHLILEYRDRFRKTEQGWRFEQRQVGRLLDNEGL